MHKIWHIGILEKYRKHLSHADLLNELRSVVGEKAGVCGGWGGRLGGREGRLGGRGGRLGGEVGGRFRKSAKFQGRASQPHLLG